MRFPSSANLCCNWIFFFFSPLLCMYCCHVYFFYSSTAFSAARMFHFLFFYIVFYGCFLSTHHCIIEIHCMFGIMMSLRKSWWNHDFVEAHVILPILSSIQTCTQFFRCLLLWKWNKELGLLRWFTEIEIYFRRVFQLSRRRQPSIWPH
jgi:hypothetical protein